MGTVLWLALGLVLAAAFAAWIARVGRRGERAVAARRERRARRSVGATKPPSSAPISPPVGLEGPPSSAGIKPPAPPVAADAEDDDDDITRITVTPEGIAQIRKDAAEREDDTTRVLIDERAVPIVFDDDAALDEPTGVSPLILVSAAGQSDTGRVRRRNEDCYAMLDAQSLYIVADGMGGHAGGDVASRLAVDIVSEAFEKSTFVGRPHAEVPRRGAEVVTAIQMANHAIFEQATSAEELEGMGTTIVAARFSPNKQRVYVGHVGDSRCYRLRAGQLTQMTTDHTMRAQGVASGPFADHLSRAVGVQAGVRVDLVIARPLPYDRFLLCSDGLSKMVGDEPLRKVLLGEQDLARAVEVLIEQANKSGGRDNITVILVEVRPVTAARGASTPTLRAASS
jgi:protein phosphatase